MVVGELKVHFSYQRILGKGLRKFGHKSNQSLLLLSLLFLHIISQHQHGKLMITPTT